MLVTFDLIYSAMNTAVIVKYLNSNLMFKIVLESIKYKVLVWFIAL